MLVRISRVGKLDRNDRRDAERDRWEAERDRWDKTTCMVSRYVPFAPSVAPSFSCPVGRFLGRFGNSPSKGSDHSSSKGSRLKQTLTRCYSKAINTNT